MRLTLRTLLAYLDDILEPNQAREIGKKIGESNFATGLIDRIREVMRRRRLTAPEVEGPDSSPDANTIAEYLDNTLPPESVADVERICLESDMHLAEVAASHQILALVLGEPVDIPDRTRERMYALGVVSAPTSSTGRVESDGHRGDDGSRGKGATAETSPVSNAPVTTTSRREFSEGIPAYLRPTPLWRRTLPIVALLLVAVGWLWLMSRDEAFFGDPQQDITKNQPTEDAEEVAPKETVADGSEPASENVAETPGDEVVDDGPAVIVEPPDVVVVPPVEPGTEPIQPIEPIEAIEPVQPVQPGIEPPIVVDDRPQVPEVKEVLVAAPSMTYRSAGEVALRYREPSGVWLPLAPNATIEAGERIAVPEPFDAEFEIGDGAARLTLHGGSTIGYVAPVKGVAFAFELGRGAFTLERLSEQNADARGNAKAEPLVMALFMHGRPWRLSLLAPGTRCGVEIDLREPRGFEQDLGEEDYTGELYVVEGAVRFSDAPGRDRNVEVRAGEWLPLTPGLHGLNPNEALPEPGVIVMAPPWLDPQGKRSSIPASRARNLFINEFAIGEAVGPSLEPEVRNPRPLVSELAVKCLALTDNHQALVHSLANAPHDEARAAAISGLRVWLGQDVGHGKLLREELERRFPPATAEAAYRLLWGFDVKDARDPAISRQLVDWLKHDHVAVRQLAISEIRALTGRNYDYLPHQTNAHRQAAIIRWESHLANEGALLPPSSEPTTP